MKIVAVLLGAALVLGCASGAVAARVLAGGGAAPAPGSYTPPRSQSAAPSAAGGLDLAGIEPRGYAALPLPDEMRAMWVSFLEWRDADLSTEAAARAAIGRMMDDCAALGLNTVIAHVRALGDAMYQSSLYPFSHLLTGTQGQSPGYDPLAVMAAEAHARGLRIEAWVNPYRIKHVKEGPAELSPDNPALLHPEWVREVDGSLWLDPGLPEVRELILRGVVEIVQNYDVDGVHFDDYFYPEFSSGDADAAFDADTYARYGGGEALGVWRRGNVDSLMAGAYAAVKAANPAASFGVSVQGNNDNNYGMMYADVGVWLAQGGRADYVMPQLYWGFGHQTQSGRTDYAFGSIAAAWAAYPRADGVRLYAGLAAYRIGMLQADGSRAEFGGNGYGDQSEWASGNVMASQVAHLRGVQGFSGFALFRYAFLYQQGDSVSAAERETLAAALAG